MALNNRMGQLKSKLKTYGELVMFSHTLFSLPFALMAMFLAADGLPSGDLIFWIMLALFAGRNGANALNRYVDSEYDAKNPRTAHRHIPSGSVKRNEALYITIACYILFVFSAAQINGVCFLLSPVALGLFTLYSYTKRFTWLCHVILGITCAGAPVGAWLAVTGRFGLVPFLFAAIVTLWVSGFDIIYGTQDIEFDRSVGLFSIPARFGYHGALWIARLFHFMMWILLIALYFITNLGIVYMIGVILSGILLVLEHYMVEPSHREKMNFASYHINQIISMLLLSVTMIDVFIF
ncbi:UbiA-like polyprenyltransferase [Fusibacter sp. 3D3]|uniref:UbiA-like polyprenyltransferase n=1 Tax=Fusibacter sp. 3D3 TaxID=1048380 RepID=UPI0008566DF5|nr:UbiA-like polyprenyltransferase [Fusibacter sp. 3D3]GAU78524.1 4-hydroxybenzoate polyprenyltransferase [Fusibacter sp. 3D3]